MHRVKTQYLTVLKISGTPDISIAHFDWLSFVGGALLWLSGRSPAGMISTKIFAAWPGLTVLDLEGGS